MRASIFALTAGCAIVATGCGGSPTGPDNAKVKRLVSMSFCADYAPSWVAHLDDGGVWTRVPVANAKASFQGTEKQAVAMVHTVGDAEVSVIYTTATTLKTLTCANPESAGSRKVTGTVTGLGNNYMTAVIGPAYSSAYPGYPNFTFFGVPSDAQDLVATMTTDYTAAPDKMIIRRGQTYADNASITLDFATEGFALEKHTVSSTGASGMVLFSQAFRSAGGSRQSLQSGGGTAAMAFVPSNKLVDGDVHEITAVTSNFGPGYRGVMLIARNPGDKTLPFGPDATAPVVTTITASPRRLRAELAAPAEYATGVTLMYNQPTGPTYHSYEVTVLTDYLGALPDKWSLEMPDLSKVDGFQASWMMTSGSYDWSLQLIDGPIYALISGEPSDGSLLRFAVLESASAPPTMAGAPVPTNRVPSLMRPRSRLIAGGR